MTSEPRNPSLFALLLREWREIGGLGQLALAGVAAAGALAILLGFSITSAARGHLLDARSEIISGTIDDLATRYPDPLYVNAYDEFDASVRERLLGGETVRVKVWLPDGTISYSDDVALIGLRFDLSPSAQRAFGGERATQVSDLSEPEHAPHRQLGSLIEFYIPFLHQDGQVEAVFEVEQRTDLLEMALQRIERSVWLSISIGLAILGVFLGMLALARARDLNRRRRSVVRVLAESLRAQDVERLRIVGALHDDVGQPLYRLLYGLDGTRARMAADDPLRTELEGLGTLVNEIDSTLRAELKLLRHGVLADLGLEAAVSDLADTIKRETNLDLDLDLSIEREPADVPRRVIFRTAGEALTNVRKHAEATHVSVSLKVKGENVVLVVSDNGNGLFIEPGLGLTTMRERVESIGGTFSVRSRHRRGTTLRVTVPTQSEDTP